MHVSQAAADFEDSEPATTEASGQTSTNVFNLNQVSEANLASRGFDKPHEFGTTFSHNVVDPRSRDTLESPILNNTSVHVEKVMPALGGSASSFSQVTVATPLVPPTAAGQAGAFQEAADLPTPKEISPGQANQAVRSPVLEKNHVSADSISMPQIARSSPNTTLPPPLATFR